MAATRRMILRSIEGWVCPHLYEDGHAGAHQSRWCADRTRIRRLIPSEPGWRPRHAAEAHRTGRVRDDTGGGEPRRRKLHEDVVLIPARPARQEEIPLPARQLLAAVGQGGRATYAAGRRAGTYGRTITSLAVRIRDVAVLVWEDGHAPSAWMVRAGRIHPVAPEEVFALYGMVFSRGRVRSGNDRIPPLDRHPPG